MTEFGNWKLPSKLSPSPTSGGVEMERRNRCGESAEKAIRSQRPRVGAPCTGDINQEESVGLARVE